MKKIIAIIITILLLIFPFSSCKDDNTIELNEVTHSVFYAPLYVAIENGYFNDEGIKINLTNGGGADNSMTALLSKTADIALMGPETVIYVQNQNKKDAPKVFSQLTQRDGAFLVSRTDIKNFSWENLRGKDILAGRKGGVPAMTFEYILKQKGMNIGVDYTLNFNVQFNLMTSAFVGGTSDFCTVFEPTASEYQKQGKWYVVASVGAEGGEIPYTSFIALNSYIENNKEIVKKFNKALLRAFEFIDKNTSKTVAQSIIGQFPSTEVESIETSINSYKAIDAWKKDLIPTSKSFDNLQNIMINAGELENKVEFNKLVNLSSFD